LTAAEEGYLGTVMENEGFGGDNEKNGDRAQGRKSRPRGGRGDDAGGDDSGSYFDWNEESLFIPHMPERDEVEGGFTTDKITGKDDLQLRVNKLLWRRLKLKARDMDQHVPSAFRRVKTVQKAMAEAREKMAMKAPRKEERREGGREGEAVVASFREEKESKEGGGEGETTEEGRQLEKLMSTSAAAAAVDPDVKEVRRLNRAKTVEAIEAEIGRLLVEGKMDLQMAEDERRARKKAAKARSVARGEWEGEEGGGGEDEWGDEDEDEDEEEEMAGMDDWSKIHMQDLEEALGEEVPTMDVQEEGFDAFREYAEQLIEAGGVIEYRSTMADKYDREVALPLPLATGRALEQALRKDQAALNKTPSPTCAPEPPSSSAAPDYDATAAFAWLALNKNLSMGDTTRAELSEAMASTLQRLQEKPGRLERVRARVKAAAASGLKTAGAGGDAGEGGGGGRGGGKGKGGGKMKAK